MVTLTVTTQQMLELLRLWIKSKGVTISNNYNEIYLNQNLQNPSMTLRLTIGQPEFNYSHRDFNVILTWVFNKNTFMIESDVLDKLRVLKATLHTPHSFLVGNLQTLDPSNADRDVFLTYFKLINSTERELDHLENGLMISKLIFRAKSLNYDIPDFL